MPYNLEIPIIMIECFSWFVIIQIDSRNDSDYYDRHYVLKTKFFCVRFDNICETNLQQNLFLNNSDANINQNSRL